MKEFQSQIKNLKSNKVLVLLGPTSSGKTEMAVDLALKFNGEIISADSRQVYRGLDIGSGKDLDEYQRAGVSIPYHLIDIVSPRRYFNLYQYKNLATKAIIKVLKKDKVAILSGGTGLYLQALVDNYNLPSENKQNKERLRWEKLGAEKLFSLIQQENKEFADRLNNSDKNNARRLARYLEIIRNPETDLNKKSPSPFSFLILGIKIDDDLMKKKIRQRLDYRLKKQGLIEEVEGLIDSGVSIPRLLSLGLEYKFVSQYILSENKDYETLRNNLSTAIYRFAKRQKTWFRRWEKQGAKIIWINDKKEAQREIEKFLL